MEVTAEGVDTAGALALLRMMGCDLIQGYLISKPLDIESFSAFLSAEIRVEESRPFIANLPVRQIK